MKIMGLDISSKSTGWCVINDDGILDYGLIQPSSKMSLAQKMYLFYVEIGKLIEKYQPHSIAIEDVVDVMNISVTKTLARFNGVAIIKAYECTKTDPILYKPSEWKKSLDGCTGGSKKCEIQLSICKIFNLLDEDKCIKYLKRIREILNKKVNDDELKKLRVKINRLKKKKDFNKNEIVELTKQVKLLEKDVNKNRQELKKIQNKELEKIDIEIYSLTGISNDIADAFGVALKNWREFND